MLAVLANSDGRADLVLSAVEMLRDSGAQYAIHCGDIGGRQVLDSLAEIGGGFVWGDRDHDRTGLMRYGHAKGLVCWGLLGDFLHRGKRVAVVHGDNKPVLKQLIKEQQYDYILHGHESAEDRTVGKTRIINPGPLYGNARNALLLDLRNGESRTIEI